MSLPIGRSQSRHRSQTFADFCRSWMDSNGDCQATDHYGPICWWCLKTLCLNFNWRPAYVVKLKATGARILEVDYTDERTIAEAAKQYGSGPLDCLVNCGGMLDKVPTFKAIFKFLGVGPQPFDWDAGSGERILEMFNIMSVVCGRAHGIWGHCMLTSHLQGPYLAIKHFMPNLQKSSVPKIAVISSEFGCISSNVSRIHLLSQEKRIWLSGFCLSSKWARWVLGIPHGKGCLESAIQDHCPGIQGRS